MQVYRQVRGTTWAACLLGEKSSWGKSPVISHVADTEKPSPRVGDAHHTTLGPIWHYYRLPLALSLIHI